MNAHSNTTPDMDTNDMRGGVSTEYALLKGLKHKEFHHLKRLGELEAIIHPTIEK